MATAAQISVVFILVGFLVATLGFFLLCFILVRQKVRKKRAAAVTKDEEDMLEAVSSLTPTRFSFKELDNATRKFSTKLGAGGFGSVFLGVLSDGSEVAVKCLEGANQGWKEFLAEVRIIGSIHHVNLVRLRGFCLHKNHRLLVYEYMPNGSLEKWLFGPPNNSLLDWDLRSNIALGIARDLAYLHEECSQRIIHFDIKPPNILLDSKFVAKVSDFGLSKLVNREQSHVVTIMRGTPGYLAPEWLYTIVTEKADIYSFGTLLLEIASGRKCLQLSHMKEDSDVRHISVWASKMVEQGRLMDVIDARLGQALKPKEAERMVKVALWCIQESPAKRPSMGNVVQMLEGVADCPNPLFNVSHLTHTSSSNIDDNNLSNATESTLMASILSCPR